MNKNWKSEFQINDRKISLWKTRLWLRNMKG